MLNKRVFLFLKKKTDMWLIVGLGNPGDKHKGNRHNIGFMAIDALAQEYSIGPFKSKFQGEFAEGRIGGEKVVLLKPQTFMNESGQSVGQVAKFYKIAPGRVIVFHDELDLQPSHVRVRLGGGLAGHNGLKSIKAHLGTPDFKRVRLGIGHPGDKTRVSGYVLSDFAKVEQGWLDKLIPALAEYVSLLLKDNGDDFMTRVSEASK